MLNCLRRACRNAERTRGRGADGQKQKAISLSSVLHTPQGCADDRWPTVLTARCCSCPRARGDAIFFVLPPFFPTLCLFLCLANAATKGEGTRGTGADKKGDMSHARSKKRRLGSAAPKPSVGPKEKKLASQQKKCPKMSTACRVACSKMRKGADIGYVPPLRVCASFGQTKTNGTGTFW